MDDMEYTEGLEELDGPILDGISVKNGMFALEWPEPLHQQARELSEYIKALPLTVEQNDRLVDMLICHMRACESNAFQLGIRFGKTITEHIAAEEATELPLYTATDTSGGTPS